MAQSATYSFLNTSGQLTNALVDPINFQGQIGMGAFTIEMHTDRSVLDTAADGTIMPSYVAGNSGTITIEMQQTSILHGLLLDLYNALVIAANNGDVSQWANSSMTLRNTTVGNQHTLTGVLFSKKPSKPYHAQGSKITWSLLACDIQETTA
jgi:Protein of unknown function (DUF3277)